MKGVLDIGGGFEARVLLTGTPIFDPLVGEIAFPDLVVSIESDDILARLAGRLIAGELSKRARALAKIRVNDALTQQLGGSSELSVRLAGGGLETRLDALEVTNVAARPGGLIVRSRIRPEMTLRLP